MTAPNKFTGTVKVWTTSKWCDLTYVLDSLKQGKAEDVVGELTYTNHDMSNCEDWTEIGTAEITVTLHPRDTVVEKELAGLKQQLEKVRADNHMRENAILDRISKLQAIEYVGEA
jgi:hypothetical protein